MPNVWCWFRIIRDIIIELDPKIPELHPPKVEPAKTAFQRDSWTKIYFLLSPVQGAFAVFDDGSMYGIFTCGFF